jgi:hypothetical protein
MIYIKIIFSVLIFYFFLGIVLSVIAKLLAVILEIPNLICAIILHIRSRGFLKVIDEYQFQSAYEMDVFLHYNFRALWQLTLGTTKRFKGYIFGTNKDETLSSAIGLKSIEKTLSWVGWVLYIILFIIDFKTWKKGGHCKDAYYSYIKKHKTKC